MPSWAATQKLPVFARSSEDFLDAALACCVRGDAGVGKTSLVALALHEARRQGSAIVASTSVQSETELAFAGLHLLIQPLLDDVDRLPAGQRRALLAAFGMIDAPTPDRFLIALATLELLANAARKNGLVVAIGDAQWLDAPTATVMSFVARRCAARRVVLLLEVREGHSTPLSELGLPELRVEPLGQESAMALLNARSPELPEVTRDRVLALAAGNPLALVELPKLISDKEIADGGYGQRLTLTRRLEGAFGARLAELPATTRTLLVIAAENDEAWINEVIAAAATIDAHAGAAEFGPAVEAGLLSGRSTGESTSGIPWFVLRFRRSPCQSSVCAHTRRLLRSCRATRTGRRGIWLRQRSNPTSR